jgi:hypothetical protein
MEVGTKNVSLASFIQLVLGIELLADKSNAKLSPDKTSF